MINKLKVIQIINVKKKINNRLLYQIVHKFKIKIKIKRKV